MEIIFWAALLILIHTWGGYAAVLYLLSKVKGASPRPGDKTYQPSVTVLLTVRNEEAVIRKRLENLLDTDYPAGRYEIAVASDGSTDRTDEIVERMAKSDVRIRLLKTRGGGKSATQNAVIPTLQSDIIVLTDAQALFTRTTVSGMVRAFSDRAVGCVSGRLVLIGQDSSISESQGIYWKYETVLRRLESGLGLFHTASGQVMAFRRELFVPFPPNHGDDCVIPLDVLLKGSRVVHEDSAVAYDTFHAERESELKARIRMTLRNITCTLSKYRLLNALRYPGLCYAILSHKVIRWLTPYIMILLFLSNAFVYGDAWIYRLVFWGQVVFYGAAVAGYAADLKKIRIPLATQIYCFMLANAGFFVGILKTLLGKKITFYRS